MALAVGFRRASPVNYWGGRLLPDAGFRLRAEPFSVPKPRGLRALLDPLRGLRWVLAATPVALASLVALEPLAELPSVRAEAFLA